MKHLFTLFIAILVVSFSQAQKTELGLKLEKGKEYKQLMNSISEISQDINGQVIDMKMTLKSDLIYRVTAINNHVYDLDVQYKDMSMDLEHAFGAMSYSSVKNDETDIISLALKEMTNNTFQIKMTHKGKVTEVKNLDKLFDSILEKFPNLSTEEIQDTRNILAQSYGEESYKGNIEMITAIFPDVPVAIGENWKIKTELKSEMRADITTTYTFKEKASKYHFIQGISQIQTIKNDNWIETNVMYMKYDLSGSMHSDIKIDTKSGWITEANIKQDIIGDCSVQENEQLPEGMKIPITMKNNIVYTSK